jgi:hypothetical protein
VSALPEGSRCGLHGLSTESGRCARCDEIADWPLDKLPHDDRRRRVRLARGVMLNIIVHHPNLSRRELLSRYAQGCREQGICRDGLDPNHLLRQLEYNCKIASLGNGRWAQHPDHEAAYIERQRARAERATTDPLRS